VDRHDQKFRHARAGPEKGPAFASACVRPFANQNQRFTIPSLAALSYHLDRIIIFRAMTDFNDLDKYAAFLLATQAAHADQGLAAMKGECAAAEKAFEKKLAALAKDFEKTLTGLAQANLATYCEAMQGAWKVYLDGFKKSNECLQASIGKIHDRQLTLHLKLFKDADTKYREMQEKLSSARKERRRAARRHRTAAAASSGSDGGLGSIQEVSDNETSE
jgi:hypothetical protein